LLVAKTGERVAKGQVLATIYSPELVAAQSELLNATRWASRGESKEARSEPASVGHPKAENGLVEDTRARLELLGISPEEIEKVERAGKPSRGLAIRSPVEGHVIRKEVLAGSRVEPGT